MTKIFSSSFFFSVL